MSVTAAQLSKTSMNAPIIVDAIKTHIHAIDAALRAYQRVWGENIVSYDLPTMFVFPGLDKRDAQRIVYVSIIKSLVSRGFEIRLFISPTESRLFIKWTTDLDEEELLAMNRILRKAIIKKEDLPSFLTKKGAGLGAGRSKPPAPPAVRNAPARTLAPVGLPGWAAGGAAPPPLPPDAARAVASAALGPSD